MDPNTKKRLEEIAEGLTPQKQKESRERFQKVLDERGQAAATEGSTAPGAPSNVAGGQRFRVRVHGAAAPAQSAAKTTGKAAARKSEKETSLDVVDEFKDAINDTPETYNAFLSLRMVVRLLKHHYNDPESPLEAMGFDQENLENLMQAVFSQARGQLVPKGKIVSYLQYIEGGDEAAYETLCYELLGLGDSSGISTIHERVKELTERLEKLDEFFEYAFHTRINKALDYIENPEVKLSTKDIIEKAHLAGKGKIFEVDDIEFLMAEVARGGVEPIENINILDAEFDSTPDEEDATEEEFTAPESRTRRPVAEGYLNYYRDEFMGSALGAFWLAHFKGTAYLNSFLKYSLGHDDWNTVAQELDQVLSDPPHFGISLLLMLREGAEATEILEDIADAFGINNHETLRQKINEISHKIATVFPHLSSGTILSDGSDNTTSSATSGNSSASGTASAPAASSPAPKGSGPASPTVIGATAPIDFESFSKNVLEKVDNGGVSAVLFRLFHFLRAGQENYENYKVEGSSNPINFKAKYFNGKSYRAVISKLDDRITPEWRQILEQAAQRADLSGRNNFFPVQALCQEVANANDNEQTPEELVAFLRNLRDEIGWVFPQILIDGDPYKKEVLSVSPGKRIVKNARRAFENLFKKNN